MDIWTLEASRKLDPLIYMTTINDNLKYLLENNPNTKYESFNVLIA